jgi:stalled ribosome rescue protein Dom34
MRILSKHVHMKSQTFVVRLALEQDTDDAWNLFNLINYGDLIKASAYR